MTDPAIQSPTVSAQPAVHEATDIKPSVRERLKAYKASNSGDQTTELPKTGIVASYPAFLPHDAVMSASRMAGKKKERLTKILIAKLFTFEGEKLTADEVGADLPNEDVVHMTNILFPSDGADEDGEGN